MDIKSKDLLKQALLAYDGTLVIVSHDRDFLDGLVGKLYEFRDGKVKEFLGSVSEFLESRKLENLRELERAEKAGAASGKGSEKPAPKPAPRPEKKAGPDRKTKQRISWLESEIARLEESLSSIEATLSAPKEGDDILELTREYLEKKRELDARTEEWESLYVKFADAM